MFKTILTAAFAAACLVGTANAHMVTFGWTDNGNGSVTLWAEHWHSDQLFPCSEGIKCSDNGGLTISGDGTAGTYGTNPYTVQWAGTLNNTDRDDMITDGTLLGYQDVPGNAGGGTYDDWLFTQPLVIGDGTWYFFTGTNCCIDTMGSEVEVALSGIGSVDPGTGPGDVGDGTQVPTPAILPLLGSGLILLSAFGRKRKRSKKD